MSLLSEDAIAALVDQAREAPARASTAPGRRRPRTIKAVDFRRTVKFKAEHQDRLKRAVETFSRVAATRLATELRTTAELELMYAEQGMWSRVHGEVASNCLCFTIAAEPDQPPLVLALDQPLVLAAVDRLLGSDGRLMVVDRGLTDLDKRVATRLCTTLAYCFSSAWKELCGEELQLLEVLSYEQVADVVPVEEPTLALTVEVRLEEMSAALAILVPFNAIGTLVARLHTLAPSDQGAGEVLRRSLGDVEVELRAEVGNVSMTIDQVLRLAPGDIVALGSSVAHGVDVYADRLRLLRARPGRNGHHRAVQIDAGLDGRR